MNAYATIECRECKFPLKELELKEVKVEGGGWEPKVPKQVTAEHFVEKDRFQNECPLCKSAKDLVFSGPWWWRHFFTLNGTMFLQTGKLSDDRTDWMPGKFIDARRLTHVNEQVLAQGGTKTNSTPCGLISNKMVGRNFEFALSSVMMIFGVEREIEEELNRIWIKVEQDDRVKEIIAPVPEKPRIVLGS